MAFGFFLIAVGTSLLVIGEMGLNTIHSCPLGGCSDAVTWQISGNYWIESYSGLAVVALGIALLTQLRRMR